MKKITGEWMETQMDEIFATLKDIGVPWTKVKKALCHQLAERINKKVEVINVRNQKD